MSQSPRAIREKEGRSEASEVFVVTPGTYRSRSLAQLGPGRPATLTTHKQKVVFCFQGFVPGAVVLVLATGGQQCLCPQWSN